MINKKMVGLKLVLAVSIFLFSACTSGNVENAAVVPAPVENKTAVVEVDITTEAPEASTEDKTAAEALEIVKAYIEEGNTDVFEPLNEENQFIYYYKNSNYMIEYDNYNEQEQYHLIHEYEIVIDDEDQQWGHTATVNWYQVDANTGEVTPMFP